MDPQGLILADDAGQLLIRAGLVNDHQVMDARRHQTAHGGTLGEHLVLMGAIDDEVLTQFFHQALMVPRANPNRLAQVPRRPLSMVPADMAAEFRLIPVGADREQNLTLAMSNPANSHAVDEITFFTSHYVLRQVATQTQIAWCLAHYYGIVTALGETLMEDTPVSDGVPEQMSRDSTARGKGSGSRHRVLPPLTSPIQRVTVDRALAKSNDAVPRPAVPRPAVPMEAELSGPTGPMKTKPRPPTPTPAQPPARELRPQAGELSVTPSPILREQSPLPAVVIGPEAATHAANVGEGATNAPEEDDAPVLLLQKKLTQPESETPNPLDGVRAEDSVVILNTRKARRVRSTQLGVGIASGRDDNTPASTAPSAANDSAAGGVPETVADDADTAVTEPPPRGFPGNRPRRVWPTRNHDSAAAAWCLGRRGQRGARFRAHSVVGGRTRKQ